MARILSGAEIAERINRKTGSSAAFLASMGAVPALAIIRMGDRPDDVLYERGIANLCEGMGIKVARRILKRDADQKALMEAIRSANEDPCIHGILLLRPLPEQIDDAHTLFLAKDIAKKIEQELEYPGQIKVNVIREFRGVEYAK